MHTSAGPRLAALLALALPSAAQSGGQWEGPFDWEWQLNPLDCKNPGFDEISHAALIPVGPYRGRVMIWREGVSPTQCASALATDVWIFMPEDPGRLYRVQHSVNFNIFCSGGAWDADGKMLLSGGHPFGSPPPDHGLLFDPSQLGELLYPARPLPPPGRGPPVASFGPPVISGNPWSANFPMSIGRYYPTIVSLDRRPIDSSCLPGTIPGGSQLVIGGWPGGWVGNEGNELWQIREAGTAAWGRTFTAPAGVPGQHAPSGGGPTEAYALVPPHGQPGSPQFLLDSYPRAFQMAEYDPAMPVHGQIFVAGDVETLHFVTQPTAPGRTWVIKSPASTASGCWELLRGPQAGNDHSPGTYDRWYGSAVLLHTLAARNRVLVFGGSQPTGGPDYNVIQRVQEFTPSSTPGTEPIAGGSWAFKASLVYPRVYPNAVVLPTGKILVEGGFGDDFVHNTSGDYPCLPLPCPRFAPELYDPGTVGTLGSTALLAQGNPVAPFGTPFPRGYHHVAVLLPDGRVFVASGGDFRQPNPPVYPHGHYSGEIYSPPYLFQGPRPAISAHPSSAAFSSPAPSTFQIDIDVKRDHLAKIVLTRPASVTHHFDCDQRLIELAFDAPKYTSPATITATVTAPEESLGPPGWYMLWAVEADAPGAAANLLPSDAAFIRLN